MPKKQLLIGGIALGVVAVAAAGYFGYQAYQHQVTIQQSSRDAAVKKAAALNLRGDKDIAAAYLEKLEAKDTRGAQKLFADAVAKEPDVTKKLALLSQNVQLALSAKQKDLALESAQRAVEIQKSDDTYMQLARVYVMKDDPAQQAVAIEQAITLLDASKKENKDSLRAVYEQQLQVARELAADRKKVTQ